MYQTWETIEENLSYIGDLYDQNGRRRVLLIHQGIAVFAKCTIEEYYMMKEDFSRFLQDIEFIKAGSVTDNITHFSDDLYRLFDTDTLQEVDHYIRQSVQPE